MQGYDLPGLPVDFDFETRSVLKKSIVANRAPAVSTMPYLNCCAPEICR